MSKELYKLSNDPCLAQNLSNRKGHICSCCTKWQLTGEFETNNSRNQHRYWLAKQSGLGFNSANAPAQDTGDYEAILTHITTKYPKTPPSDAEEIATNLVAYGKDHQVDPKLIAALIARESGFNKTAISKSGAIGLGQIKSLNFNHLKIDDPFDIKENVQGTVKYMSLLMNVWKDKSENVQWALASYYKGPTAIRKSEGKIDEQTKSYVSDILKYYDSISQMKNSIISKAP